MIDSESLIVAPEVAEANRPQPPEPSKDLQEKTVPDEKSDELDPPEPIEEKPTRFIGTVMISAERPARDIHQVIEAVVEQLATIPGSEVSLKLEIDAEIPSGLDRGKVRTLVENANTLGFIEKTIR